METKHISNYQSVKMRKTGSFISANNPIRLVLFLFFTSIIAPAVYGQDAVFTWINGPKRADSVTSDLAGVYGTKGVADPANKPGVRVRGNNWKDKAGNLWLFGGKGYDKNGTLGYLNDLWKYDPSTNLWTWVGGKDTYGQPGVYGTKGVASADNLPVGVEQGSSWTDEAGNFWLFGGVTSLSTGAMWLHDLWKYDPVNNTWTWVSGSGSGWAPGSDSGGKGKYGTQGITDPTNLPGARYGSVPWADAAGNFWIYGGSGLDADGLSGRLNDIWKFTPVTNQWTWIGGSNLRNQYPGVYGIKGIADPANIPPPRITQNWKDKDGNLWIFGGIPTVTSNLPPAKQDLWKYDPSANLWTWMGGSELNDQPGVYGTKGIADPANLPGARFWGSCWTDQTGNFWLFGGQGFDKNGTFGYLSDLWKYNPATNQWTWVLGPDVVGQAGVYGTKGTVQEGNITDPRVLSITWSDNSDNLWFFGGYDGKYFNDLWRISLTNIGLNAGPTNRTYSDAPVPISVTGTAGLPVTVTSSDVAILQVANDAKTFTIKSVGKATITATINGTTFSTSKEFTISKAAQTIAFSKPADVSETAVTFSLSATTSSSLVVAFVSADQNKLTISGNTATIIGPGLATVKATQTGNNNYEAAAEVSQSFCILPAKPVVTTSGLGTGSTVLTSSAKNNIQWFRDGQPLSGQTSPDLPVEDGGVYSVKCSVDGCATESDVVSLIVTAIGKESQAIRLYPNPAKDELRLTLPESTDGSILQAEIIDAFGRPVRGQRVNGGEAVFRIEGLAPGHYFIRVTGQKQQVYRRFIKQ